MSDSNRKFTVEVRDYESGRNPDRLSAGRIERAVQRMLDHDGSDGIVIVTENDA